MGYLVVKTKKGIPYLYEQETFREGGRVRTKNRYLGRCIDQQAGVVQEGDTVFLCDRTTYRPKGKKAEVTRIDKKGPATAEEIAGLLNHEPAPDNTPSIPREPATFSDRVQISGDLSRLDLTPAKFGREYQAFFERLRGSAAIDAQRLPPISIKPGHKTGSKKRWFGRGYVVTVSRDRGAWGIRRGLKREFRRTLARAGLDFLEKNRPQIFRQLTREFKASYKAFNSSLADYTRYTKDRHATGKAALVKRGYFRRTYRNPLKLQELGRVDDRHYADWKDEFCSLVAEVQTKGHNIVFRRFAGELHKAQSSHRHTLKAWKETKPYHLAVIGERRRKLKRAAAREQAIKNTLKKLHIARRVLNY